MLATEIDVMGTVAVGALKDEGSTRERLVVDSEISVGNGIDEGWPDVCSEVTMLPPVLERSETVPVCTSEVDSEVKESSGTPVGAEGSSVVDSSADGVVVEATKPPVVAPGTSGSSCVILVEVAEAPGTDGSSSVI
jgi:hypothetical protein